MIDSELRQLFESAVAETPPDTTDLDRAVREGTQRRRQRQITVSTAATAGVALTVVAVVAAVAMSGPGRGTTNSYQPAATPSASVSKHAEDVAAQTAENQRLARAASQAALQSFGVVLPASAQRLDGKPAGWPDADTSLGPSDGRLTSEGWWSLPLSDAEVTAFLTDQAPAGMRHPSGEDVIDSPGSDGIKSTEYVTLVEPDPAAFSGTTVLVQFKQLGDRTVLRADTFLFARSAVSDDHRIHSNIAQVRIQRIGRNSKTEAVVNVHLPTVTLSTPRDAADIERLVGAFNALYGSPNPELAMGCPFEGDPSPKITVTFVEEPAGDGSSKQVVATWIPACWGQVAVTADGVPLRGTLDPGSFQSLVDQIADAHS